MNTGIYSAIRDSDTGSVENENKTQNEAQAKSNLAVTDPMLGTVIAGRYKIKDLIATGGWGSVYKASHVNLGIDLAVKVVHPHLAANTEGLRRFELEAVLLHKLNSPYIVRVMDYGRLPQPYIVMEYFDGSSLETLIESGSVLEPQLALDFFLQLCEGLNSAAELGLVHRDLKPGNLLYKIHDQKLELKIVDFGIAKLAQEAHGKITTTGEILGSPPYMAPEQWSGMADHRSDIYTLGCIMFEAICGKRPFSSLKAIDYFEQHLNALPPKFADAKPGLKAPAGIEQVIRKCLQKSPEHRYQSSKALQADLEKIKAGRKVSIWLPDDRRKELMLAVITAWVIAGLTIFFLVRDPVLSYFVDALNTKAKQEFDAGKDSAALASLKQSANLGLFLPERDSRRLQAMQMLSLVLKLNGHMKEAEELDIKLAKVQAVQDMTLAKAAEDAAKKKPHVLEMVMPNRFHAEAVEYIDLPPDALWKEIGDFKKPGWHQAVKSCSMDASATLPTRKLLVSYQSKSDKTPSIVSMSPEKEGFNISEKLLGTGTHSMCFQLTDGLPVHPTEILKVDPCPVNPSGSVVTMSANFFEPHLDPVKAKLYSEQMLDFYIAGLKGLQKKYAKRIIVSAPAGSCVSFADITEAPDSERLAQNLIAQCDNNFKNLASLLGLSDSSPAKKFEIEIVSSQDAAESATHGNVLTFNRDLLADNKSLDCVSWQIAASIFQSAKVPGPGYESPRWFARAVCDYARAKTLPENSGICKGCGVEDTYMSSSKCGAEFLIYIENKYRTKKPVQAATKAWLDGRYRDSIWKELTGHDLKTLWQDFLNSNPG